MRSSTDEVAAARGACCATRREATGGVAPMATSARAENRKRMESRWTVRPGGEAGVRGPFYDRSRVPANVPLRSPAADRPPGVDLHDVSESESRRCVRPWLYAAGQ